MNNDNSQLKDIFITIFKLANASKYNMEEFITSFFKSKECDQIVKYSNEYYLNPYKYFDSFINNKTFKIEEEYLSNDIVIYLAFIYYKFILISGDKINKIIKILPVKDVIDNYDYYHTISEDRVIFISNIQYNIKMNPMRKIRSKNNPILSFDNEDKNLFLAKRLYLKLFNYSYISNLIYRYKSFPYLINNKALMVTDVIDNISNLKSSIENNKYDYVKYNVDNTILFVFSNSILDIKDIKNIINNGINISFNNILVFDNQKIVFISINEYKVFYLDINTLDLNIIEQEYRDRYNG